MTFSERIRAARRELGLTQAQFGALGGIDVGSQTVSNWETGRSPPWPSKELRVLDTIDRLLNQQGRHRRRVSDLI